MHRLTRVRGFVRRAATEEEIRAYVAGCDGSARVRPGLLSNPMARANWRSVGHDRLVPLLPDELAAVSTPSPSDLPWALDYLLFQRGCNVLAVNGGDGTIHHTVHAALEVCDRASARLGEDVPLPTFLLLNGGGMNMLARVFETRGHPVRTVRRFLEAARGARLGTLETRSVPLLAVEEPGGVVRHGFIFGSELVLNALTMYERFGQGYAGLARFLWEVAIGYALKTDLWRRYGHLLDPPDTPLVVDDRRWERYTCVVASTVPMQLARGVVQTIDRTAERGTLEGLVVTETDPGRVIRLIPRLMRGRPGSGVESVHRARRIELRGPYTLDGELISRIGGDESEDDRVVVRGTHRVVRGVWPHR
ncbi:MAG: hypothetical protein ACQEXJ_06265 [Myxococcota bacterium]